MRKMTDNERNLVEKNHALIYVFLKMHKLSVEQYYDIAALGLCEAAMSYDGFSDFDSYAMGVMWAFVSKEQREQEQASLVSYEAITSEPRAGLFNLLVETKYGPEELVETNSLFSEFIRDLPLHQQQVVLLYLGGYTQQEIAEFLGCSQAAISRMQRRLSNDFSQKLNY